MRRGSTANGYQPGYRTGRPVGLGLASVRRFGYGHRGRSADGEIRPALSIHRLATAGATRAPALPALPSAGSAPAAARADTLRRTAAPTAPRTGEHAAARPVAATTPSRSPAAALASRTAAPATASAAVRPSEPVATTRASAGRHAATPGSAPAPARSSAPTAPTGAVSPAPEYTAAPAPQPVRRVTDLAGVPAHRHSLACPTDCATPAAGAPAVRRLAAVGMTDLFSTTRAAAPHVHSASGETPGVRTGLATGFGPSVTIVPAGAVGGLSAGTAGPLAGLAGSAPRPTLRRAGSAPVPTTLRRTAASGSAAVAPTTGPGRRDAVAAAVAAEVSSVLSAPGGRAHPSGSSAAPGSLRRFADGGSGNGRAAGAIARSAVPRAAYAPAPPPISIRPAPMAGPELPASARDVRDDATPGIVRRTPSGSSYPQWAQPPAGQSSAVPSGSGSSLAQSTAHLFQAARLADSPVRRSTPHQSGGSSVSTPSDRTVRRSVQVADLQASPVYSAQQPADRLDLDEIVERVIDKIEERVVDELERRGRFYTPGMF